MIHAYFIGGPRDLTKASMRDVDVDRSVLFDVVERKDQFAPAGEFNPGLVFRVRYDMVGRPIEGREGAGKIAVYFYYGRV